MRRIRRCGRAEERLQSVLSIRQGREESSSVRTLEQWRRLQPVPMLRDAVARFLLPWIPAHTPLLYIARGNVELKGTEGIRCTGERGSAYGCGR
eukprot:13184543-Ditylum_brightwellii.AAC.1